MRVLVTGGAGFLGSHLCDALLAQGHSVVCADNLLTGSLQNIAHLRNEPRFEFREQDVCLPFDFGASRLTSTISPRPPAPSTTWSTPSRRCRSARIGTMNCLELAKKYGAKFFLASTSECYGDPLEHPQKETYWGHVNPIGPRSVYDEAKRFAEATTMAYHRLPQGGHAHRAHLQHLRTAPAAQRRPRDFELHEAGVARRGPDGVRQRLADPQLLLCQRRSRRHSRAGEFERARAHEHRQSRRVHDSGVRAGSAGSHRHRKARSATKHFRRTIPSSVNPTSAKPSACLAGSQRSIFGPGCRCRWNTSKAASRRRAHRFVGCVIACGC